MSSPTILIIKPSSLGDIVHGLLVAQMIKVGLPQSRIDWVCRDIFSPLVAACPVVDDVLLFERHGGPSGFLRLVRDLRRRRYSHVLDMQGLARSGLIALLARADKVLGRSDAREGAALTYNRRAPLPASGRRAHAVAILSEFLPLLGLPRQVGPRLPFRMEKQKSDRLMPWAIPASPTEPILIFPESSRVEKNWSGFALLTDLLIDALPGTPVVWAGARHLTSHQLSIPALTSSSRFHNLTGKTTLAQLPPLLAKARLVVGNDSGPLHLAAALGVPTLALFGPTEPDLYRPYPGDDHQNRILRAPQGDFRLLKPATVLDFIRTMLADLNYQAD